MKNSTKRRITPILISSQIFPPPPPGRIPTNTAEIFSPVDSKLNYMDLKIEELSHRIERLESLISEYNESIKGRPDYRDYMYAGGRVNTKRVSLKRLLTTK